MSVRDLWASVALQACADIDAMHYASVEYFQAVAFFCDRGEWGKSREVVADFMNLHRDDLERMGRDAIRARHRRDGPPPSRVQHPRPVSVVVVPAAPPPPARLPRPKRTPGRIWEFNPFNPMLRGLKLQK